MWKSLAITGIAILASVSTSHAQTIDQSRGIDPRVSYPDLITFGPWDDRNYRITLEELALLAPDEAQLADPIPAFFRIELRKQFTHLRRSGPVQYPRAAVPLFYKRYGGLFRDGAYVEQRRKSDEGRSSLAERGLVNGEIKLNQVLGANEVTVEINPANSLQVIAGANNNGGQEMYYSTDGGLNWTIQGTLPNTCCDPTVDWNSNGTIAYTAALSGSIGVSLWRSFDGGQSWVDRVDLTDSGSDKEFIHVDRSPSSPYRDNVYVTWHDGNVMQFARSIDNGATFDITAFPGAPAGIGSDITTTVNGDIYYFYASAGNQTVTLLKSTDGGETFDLPVTVTPTSGIFDFAIPAMETRRAWIYAASDADRSGGLFDGSVYVAFTDTTGQETGHPNNNHTIIEVWYSRDGGSSWNVSYPHSLDDTDTVDRFNQWLKVDENGSVHVVFYDTRNSIDRTGVDLYYNHSSDGGATWGEPQRISSQTSGNLTDGQEWGDYNGLSTLSLQTMATWTDNRDGPPDSKDVYASDMDNPAAVPGFTLSGENLSQEACTPGNLADIGLNIGQVLGFTEPVTLSTEGLSPGFSASFTVNPVDPPAASVVQISMDESISADQYNFSIKGSSASIHRSLAATANIFDAPPGIPMPTSPGDGAVDVSVTPRLQWTDLAQTGFYTVEVDDDPSFGSIDFSIQTSGREIVVNPPLEAASDYYWRLRAKNSCGTGMYSAVFSFVTRAVPGDCLPSTAPVELYAWDFEDGEQGWTHASLQGPDTWALAGSNPNGGVQHWHGDNVGEISDQLLRSPLVSLPSGLSGLTLQFHNHQELEASGSGCFDGGILEISTDGGDTFVQVTAEDLLTDPFDGPVGTDYDNPLGGVDAWCGDPQAYLNSIVDIRSLAGEENVVFRWRLATDSLIARPGWDIDDVRIQGCENVPDDGLFDHGFENGDGGL